MTKKKSNKIFNWMYYSLITVFFGMLYLIVSSALKSYNPLDWGFKLLGMFILCIVLYAGYPWFNRKMFPPRKNDPEDINLEIVDIVMGANDLNKGAMVISWNSDIGFGQYTIVVMPDGRLVADSETMDSNTDKAFVKKLMSLLVEKLEIC